MTCPVTAGGGSGAATGGAGTGTGATATTAGLTTATGTMLRLPVMVLISPLWARKRNGWASGHFGRVLVEKRWWNTQIAVCRRSSLRSG